MTKERVCANTLSLPIVSKRQAPNGVYEFVHEDDYDLTTMAGRIAWFCDEFEVERPTIELDPDQVGEPLLTGSFVEWLQRSGMCMNFAFAGGTKACVQEYRRNAISNREICKTVGKFEPRVQKGFATMLEAVVHHGVPMTDALATFDTMVKEYQEPLEKTC